MSDQNRIYCADYYRRNKTHILRKQHAKRSAQKSGGLCVNCGSGPSWRGGVRCLSCAGDTGLSGRLLGIAGRLMLYAAQSGECALCDRFVDDPMQMHIDHSHREGHVRGLVCAGHNRAIGMFQDNPERLRRAAEYLETANVEFA